jgi:phage tail sheath protein FI
MQITRQFLGKKVSADLAEAWIQSIKFKLRDHKANNDILGYDVQFRADKNSPENIRLGHLTVNLGIEPAPAFKVANHEVRRYRPAVEGLVADIIARLNAVA